MENLRTGEQDSLITEFDFEKNPTETITRGAYNAGPAILQATLFVRKGINNAETDLQIAFERLLQQVQYRFSKKTATNLAIKEIVKRLSINFQDNGEDAQKVITAPMHLSSRVGKKIKDIVNEQKNSVPPTLQTADEVTQGIPVSTEESTRRKQLIAQAESIIEIIKFANTPNIRFRAITKLRELANEVFAKDVEMQNIDIVDINACQEVLARIETASRFYIDALKKKKDIQRPAVKKRKEAITGEMQIVDGVNTKPGQKIGDILQEQQQILNAKTPVPEIRSQELHETKAPVRAIQIKIPKF